MTSKKKNANYKAVAKTLSKNYWTISTVVLGILLVTILMSGSPTTGSVISAQEAGQKILSFANSQGADAGLVSVNEAGQFYEVILSIQEQQVPLYITKDGELFTQQLIPLEAATPSTPSQPTPTPTNVPKSDKPIVEAFIMSHCPYGTQIEKGLLPVAALLGDKIDFQIKFVYYAMHPSSGEVEEQLNEYCIQEEQQDKFLDYLTCFLGKTGTPADGAVCLDEVGIDKTKLETCTTKTDAEFNVLANLNDQSSWMNGRFPKFDIHKADNDKYSVGGSPTLIINGAQAQAGRDSVSLLNAICAAFETAPEECNTQFEAGQPSPGFGWSTTTTTNNAAAGCGV